MGKKTPASYTTVVIDRLGEDDPDEFEDKGPEFAIIPRIGWTNLQRNLIHSCFSG